MGAIVMMAVLAASGSGEPPPEAATPARAAYCTRLLDADLERRRAMRPYLASTDPTAMAGTDAVIAKDEAALARFRVASAGDGLDAAARQAAARGAEDVSTLEDLQNDEEGCEATACTTRARAARDADPAWARLKDCQAVAR